MNYEWRRSPVRGELQNLHKAAVLSFISHLYMANISHSLLSEGCVLRESEACTHVKVGSWRSTVSTVKERFIYFVLIVNHLINLAELRPTSGWVHTHKLQPCCHLWRKTWWTWRHWFHPGVSDILVLLTIVALNLSDLALALQAGILQATNISIAAFLAGWHYCSRFLIPRTQQIQECNHSPTRPFCAFILSKTWDLLYEENYHLWAQGIHVN